MKCTVTAPLLLVLLSLLSLLSSASSLDEHSLSQTCIKLCTSLSDKVDPAPCNAALKITNGALYKECRASAKIGFSESCMPACTRSDTLTSLLAWSLSDNVAELKTVVLKSCDTKDRPRDARSTPRQLLANWCETGLKNAWGWAIESVKKSRTADLLQGRTVEEVLDIEKKLSALPEREAAAQAAASRARTEQEALKLASANAKKNFRGGATDKELRALAEAEEKARIAEEEKANAEGAHRESEEVRKREEERETTGAKLGKR